MCLDPKSIFPDVGAYALKIGMYRAYLAKYLCYEEDYRDELAHNLTRVINERTYYYKNEHEVIIEKKDMPLAISSDAEVQKAESEYHKQLNKIKYIESIMKNLDNQSYLVGHYVKYKKWESGESGS